MPFQKGNKLAKGREKGSKNQKTQAWQTLGDFFVIQGAETYLELLKELKGLSKIVDGMSEEELKKAKMAGEAFMDRYENLLEYFKPKLARTEMTAKDGKPLLPKETLKKILGLE